MLHIKQALPSAQQRLVSRSTASVAADARVGSQILSQLEQCKAFPDFNNYLAYILGQGASFAVEVRLYLEPLSEPWWASRLSLEGLHVGPAKRGAAAKEQPKGPVCGHKRGEPALHKGICLLALSKRIEFFSS